MSRYTVTLVCLATNKNRTTTVEGKNRYNALNRAFINITGREQADCLKTWKVVEWKQLEGFND